jgi:hypothetical protein
VQVQVVSDEDREALEHIINSFQHINTVE